MKNIKGILFDFNGTLFFDSKIHLSVFRDISRELLGREFTEEFMIKSIFGRTNAKIYRDNFKADATDEECRRFNSMKLSRYFDTCLATPSLLRLVDGVADMLDYLKAQKIPYCISTGSDREEMEFFIRHLGLERWFSWDNIVYTDGSFNGKPAPDCYQLAARRIGLNPDECVVFEDAGSGILAARAAGAGALVVIHESTVPSPLDGSYDVLGEYTDLRGWRDILSDLGLFQSERK